MSLRDEQVELTRRTIIDTVIEMTADPESGRITIPDVARRCGVSRATIYRHFPTRDSLVSAAALDRAAAWTPPDGDDTPESRLRSYLISMWTDQAANLALTRQAAVSEAGRELRAARFRSYQAGTEQLLDDARIETDDQRARRLVACAEVLTSTHAFLDLHDRQQLDVQESVDTVLAGLECVMESLGISLADIPLPDRPQAG